MTALLTCEKDIFIVSGKKENNYLICFLLCKKNNNQCRQIKRVSYKQVLGFVCQAINFLIATCT